MKEFSKIDWTVTKRPVFGKKEDGAELSTDFYGVFRDDTDECLGICSERYSVLQNMQVAELLTDEFPTGAYASGTVQGGKKIWVSSNIGSHVNGLANFQVLAMSSHDGTKPLSLGVKIKIGNSILVTFPSGCSLKHINASGFSDLANKLTNIVSELEKQLLNASLEPLRNSEILSFVSDLNGAKGGDISTRKEGIINSQLACIDQAISQVGRNKLALLVGIGIYSAEQMGGKKTADERLESIVSGSAYTVINKTMNLIF